MTNTFAGRVPSFQRIGTVFTDKVNTGTMLNRAELSGWNVDVRSGLDVIQNYTSPDNMYFTVRQDTNHILGAVKSRYVPVQNETAFEWADSILDGGGEWDTAGSFNDGATVFGAMRIDTAQIVVDPAGLRDMVNVYLLVSNSHDGSRPLQASITPVRVTCQNTLNMALKGTQQSFKIKHTASAEAKAMMARDALNITFKYSQEFNDLANTMYATSFSGQQFDALVKDLFPKPEAGKWKNGEDNNAPVTRWQKTLDLVYDLRTSDTNRNINGTAWGAYNILTERIDWFRQGSDETAKAIAVSGFTPSVTQEKQRILDKVLALSGIQ